MFKFPCSFGLENAVFFMNQQLSDISFAFRFTIILITDESCFTGCCIVNFRRQHVSNHYAVWTINFHHEISLKVRIGIYNDQLLWSHFLLKHLNAEISTRKAWQRLGVNIFKCKTVFVSNGWILRSWGKQVRDYPVTRQIWHLLWGFLKEKVWVSSVLTREGLINKINLE